MAEVVAWRGHPVPGTAPEQLALVSWTHGGPRPPVRECRVLEVGCGDGANLLPLAAFRPDCEVVGVDTSAAALGVAAEGVRALGLDNVTLYELDLARVGDSLGRFDYVVAHGVLSWVSPAVQRALFALCQTALTADGLAYLSFNAQPGWLVRGMVRDLLVRATDAGDGPLERAVQARAAAARLAGVVEPEDGPFPTLLRYELQRVGQSTDWYLVHEYLAEHNRPFWFHEIQALCAEHGLRYLADARFNRAEGGAAAGLLERLGSDWLPVHPEEAVDMMAYRRFRHAVVCRQEAQAPAGHPVDAAWVASPLRPVGDTTFEGPEGARGDLDTPGLAPLLTELGEIWPRGQRDEHPEPMRAALLELYLAGHVELRLREPPPSGPTQVVRSLTRWEAARSDRVTTPYHEVLAVPDEAARVIVELDGRPPPEGLVVGEMLDFLGGWGLLEP